MNHRMKRKLKNRMGFRHYKDYKRYLKWLEEYGSAEIVRKIDQIHISEEHVFHVTTVPLFSGKVLSGEQADISETLRMLAKRDPEPIITGGIIPGELYKEDENPIYEYLTEVPRYPGTRVPTREDLKVVTEDLKELTKRYEKEQGTNFPAIPAYELFEGNTTVDLVKEVERNYELKKLVSKKREAGYYPFDMHPETPLRDDEMVPTTTDGKPVDLLPNPIKPPKEIDE